MKMHIVKIFCLMFVVMISSCSDDSPVMNNVITPDTSPMWPQAGFDARHTGNINAQKTYIQPVMQGQLDWSYTFPSSAYSDGSEFCIDSKGNIYFIAQSSPWGVLYKFTTDGKVIWKIDSVTSNNYAAISMSANEERIYFIATRPSNFHKLFCYDSSGAFLWKNDSLSGYGYGSKPTIGKDGTIYSLVGGLSAIDANGKVKWAFNTGVSSYAELSLDKVENIYTTGRNVRKISKDGILLWEFQPHANFFTWCVVIDGYNNLYFTDYRTPNQSAHLYSLNEDGQIRWTINGYGGGYDCAITKDNHIITDGDSIRMYDTSGALLWKQSSFPPGTPYSYAENVFLDGEGNIYYLGYTSPGIYACSMTVIGEIRWNYYLGEYINLPQIALSPTGKLLFSPKRSIKIYSVK